MRYYLEVSGANTGLGDAIQSDFEMRSPGALDSAQTDVDIAKAAAQTFADLFPGTYRVKVDGVAMVEGLGAHRLSLFIERTG